MNIWRIFLLVLVALASGVDALAVPFTIGTFDVARGGIGSLLSADRAEVRAAVTSSFVDVVIDGAPLLTGAWVNDHDLLWLDAVKEGTVAIVPLSTDEQLALGQFVMNGGGVIIFTDTESFGAANLSLLAPFGLVSQGTLNGNQHVTVIDPPASLVTDGHFGLITDYGTGYPGWYADLGDHALSLAILDANVQTHLAFIDRETMGAGAGGAVFMADHRTDSIPLMLNAVMAVTAAAIPTAVGERAQPQPRNLVSVHPNPFNPRTTIEFQLPVSTPALLTIYGLDGVMVATIIDGVLAAGRQSVTWDGCDSGGRCLASGIYLCRLETDGRIETARMALVR